MSELGANPEPRLPNSGVVPDNGIPAPGIGVEIPQVARWGRRGIGAESPARRHAGWWGGAVG